MINRMKMNEKANPLLNYFVSNRGRSIHKWLHYFEIYHRTFERYRDEPITFLEIGVQNGGSTQMWREYFHKDSHIIGVDIDPNCRELEKEGFEIWIGDQAEKGFWEQFKEKHSFVDIILDDGGHAMKQQVVTFLELFPILSDGGIYVVEDAHSSYLKAFVGDFKIENTFIEIVKNMIDDIHAWYFLSEDEVAQNYLANHLYNIQIFDSIVVFEKRRKTKPFSIDLGNDRRVEIGVGGLTV